MWQFIAQKPAFLLLSELHSGGQLCLFKYFKVPLNV